MPASLLFVDGLVLTQDRRAPVSDALAVVDDRIAALGDAARALQGPDTKVVRLGGKALVPGFVDAHNHLVSFGLRLMRLDLRGLRTKEELLSAVAERAAMTPEEGWVVGHSWDESRWDEGTLPTLRELDAAAKGRKALLMRVDRHGGLATTPALQAAGLPPTEAFVVEDAYYKVVDLVTPSLPTLVKAVAAATRHAHALGVTSSHVICHGRDLEALQAAREAGALGVRVSCFLGEEHLDAATRLGLRRGLGDAWVRVLGLKLYADGSFGSRTAAVSAPFLGGGSGAFNHEAGRLEALVKRAKDAGLQLAVHAIGDRAARRVLDAFEAARIGPSDRARIEHLEMVDDADVKRAASMGVVASTQPNFTAEWGHKGAMYEARLGWPRAARLNRFRHYLDAGLPVAFGSDDMPLGPLYGMRGAVEAPEEAQRVTPDEALRAYTTDAAFAGFAEDEVGRLAPGLMADLVVLSGDPRTAAGLAEADVVATLVGGRVVFGEL